MFVELIEQSELAQALRQSLWLYPVVNALHILGFALLLGSAITLDLRLLGLWSKVPLSGLVYVLRPIMLVGFILATSFGLLLFITNAADYLNSSLFISKLLLIALVVFNAVLLNQSSCWSRASSTNHCNRRLKGQALVSLILWITVMFLGRFIGYR